MSQFSVASKFRPDWNFLCQLRDAGREATAVWLEENCAAIGKRSTVDLKQELQ